MYKYVLCMKTQLQLLARTVWTFPVRIYQLLSRRLSPGRCRYHPTCSEYLRRSVMEIGILRGSAMGLLRILRCSPLFGGGIDPPPRFKSLRLLFFKVLRDYRRFFNK